MYSADENYFLIWLYRKLMANTINMLKRYGILKKIAAAVVFSLLFFLLTFAVILEPEVKITGFVSLDKNRLESTNKAISILGRYNSPIIAAKQSGSFVNTVTEYSQTVKNAFIAVEDKRFYSHNGIDWFRVAAAALNNLKSFSFAEGASTITQQLVKNTHLSNDKKISRKVQEIRIARKVEREYSKEEILSFYLNELYFGNEIYGIDAAAAYYFDKNTDELNIAEAATLAGIINNPSKYNPLLYPENSLKRRNLVLKRMLNENYISQSEYEESINAPLGAGAHRKKLPQFVYGVYDEMTEITGLSVAECAERGFTVYTSFDAELAEKMATVFDLKYKVNDGIYARAIVLENESNEIICDYASTSRAINKIKRSPGSTIKPIVCYAPALELGAVHLCTPILDERTSFNGWSPSNFNDKYFGWTDIETAIVHSLNIPAIKVLESVGLQKAVKFSGNLGIRINPDENDLSIALGTIAGGCTLNELCSAYSAFANRGKFAEGSYINRICDKKGNLIYSKINETKSAMSSATSSLITMSMQSCVKSGTAKRLNKHKNVAAKTGTVGNKNGNSDAYCIAFSPQYTVAVWCGAQDGLMPNDISGGGLPTRIASDIFDELSDDMEFLFSDEIKYLEIDNCALKRDKKILLADDSVAEINKKSVPFNKRYAPKVYSNALAFNEKKSILDDFYDFKILNSLID